MSGSVEDGIRDADYIIIAKLVMLKHVFHQGSNAVNKSTQARQTRPQGRCHLQDPVNLVNSTIATIATPAHISVLFH